MTHPRTTQGTTPQQDPRPASPRPGPPRAQADLARAQALTDHTAALEQIQELALEERAAALEGIREQLAAALRQAQEPPSPPGRGAEQRGQ